MNKQEFWRSPSGRIHGMKNCSGAGPASRMKRVMLTREEFDARTPNDRVPLGESRCRCARWREAR